MSPRRDETGGFTLVEMVIVVAIVGILASAALPLARWSVKRAHEHELREALRTIRIAIDRYNDAARAGLIEVAEGASGYPPTLEMLVEGVPMIAPMPTPAPPTVGEYAASGAGLTGGLTAMAQAQQAGQGATGIAAAGAGPGETGTASSRGARSPFGSGGGFTSAFGASRPGSSFGSTGSTFGGSTGGLAGASSFSASARQTPFGSAGRSDIVGAADSGSGSLFDREGEDGPAEPLVGPDGQPLKMIFLRRLPVDPMTGKADWGTRCYGEGPDDRMWCGIDVFDVYSRSLAKAIDGTSYRDW